jgi:hypothetical protein
VRLKWGKSPSKCHKVAQKHTKRAKIKPKAERFLHFACTLHLVRMDLLKKRGFAEVP